MSHFFKNRGELFLAHEPFSIVSIFIRLFPSVSADFTVNFWVLERLWSRDHSVQLSRQELL